MNPRIIASFAAVVGGASWVVKAFVVGLGGGSGAGDMATIGYLGGLAMLVISLAAAGYRLVETAPVWLRAVVTLAVPLLVLAVWEVVRDGLLAASSDGWLRGELPTLLGGSVAVVLGLWGLGRRRPARAVEAGDGRRAVRGPG
jgi:hypothetical protein